MPWCYPCDRYFNTQSALDQHADNAAAHQNESWECRFCDRTFGLERSLNQHLANSADHYYCEDCDRTFETQSHLNAHLHSRKHQGSNIKCPFCPKHYPTVSAMTIHLESGTCVSGLNRHRINDIIRRLDRNHVITEKLITYPGQDTENLATNAAWNGYCFECYFCTRGFNSLQGLNQHLKSPVHEQYNYHCPKCNKKYRILSGLVQHVESESCGIMKFGTVQQAGNLNKLASKLLTAR